MPDLQLIPDTDEPGARHRASRWLGLKLGVASLVLSLGPALWIAVLWLTITGRSSGAFETTASLTILGTLVLAWAGVAVGITLGVIALRRNRLIGKVAAIAGLLISALSLAYAVSAAIATATYR